MEKVSDLSQKTVGETGEKKTYLYHMVPEDMQGTTLHPLNALKDVYPDLYVAKAGKYEDRQHLRQQLIPALEALWNDVLHFSPISPTELKLALVEAGMEPKEMKFYQVDPALLDPERTLVYLNQDMTKGEAVRPEEFTNYDPQNLHAHTGLSEATKAYYKEMLASGEKPKLFVGVPHILHKGSLDISDLPVIVV